MGNPNAPLTYIFKSSCVHVERNRKTDTETIGERQFVTARLAEQIGTIYNAISEFFYDKLK